MINKIINFLLAVVMMLLPLALHADNCDDLYNQGVTMRQTQSIEAQTRAITLFTQARDCATDDDFISRCNRQIEVCNRAITRLGGQVVLHTEAPAEPDPEPELSIEPEDVPAEEPSYSGIINIEPDDSVATYTQYPVNTPGNPLTFNVNFEFKGKNPEPQVYSFNPDEAVIFVGAPEWINVELYTDSVKVTPMTNNSRNERTGEVILKGQSGIIKIIVLQKKK